MLARAEAELVVASRGYEAEVAAHAGDLAAWLGTPSRHHSAWYDGALVGYRLGLEHGRAAARPEEPTREPSRLPRRTHG